ncbi:hypothetical protein A374_04879 [Fictibacillus macauensis ZFHKF-1]|uniref:Core domain-containing protein n=1 Tax=Fictibacillus macauensis ZFHKF-1 TaxID=1196324 RepID=I8UJ16_9BACL|nr:iron-sulfur cluster biosynthesis family protein [Fictibacillus macauensis]EIT86880.1 hypothetical protein A374_04879 [Fictibacillus macauensis ZFHKF-1]
MAFSLSESVISLYRQIDFDEGEALQLFARYSGSPDHGGYAIGVQKGHPTDNDYIQEYEGLTVFVRPDDQWFVQDMMLDYDEQEDFFSFEFPAVL